MRVVSLVPSITEMLIEAGINVVGRTRFCIHPKAAVTNIPAVAGTKDINWEKVAAVAPDLVILDREENTKPMADACPYPMFVLHITDLTNVGTETERLAQYLDSADLALIGQRWHRIAQAPAKLTVDLDQVPAQLSRLNTERQSCSNFVRVDYMIWKNPWMAIGPDTFIWSVLQKLGFSNLLQQRAAKYPNLGEQFEPDPECFYLFSSEPFPFSRYQKQLEKLGFNGAVIDGECFSWYGVRSLRFLERELSIDATI